MTKFNFSGRAKSLSLGLALFAFAFLLYSNAIKGGFVWEDDEFIRENLFVKKLAYAPNFFDPTYWSQFNPFHSRFRPLRSFSFALEYSLWGLNPKWYHITNIALHGANAVLLYSAFARLPGGFAARAALFAALIFSAHPAHSESVAYIKNRTDLLATLFMLLSWFFYAKSALNRVASRSGLYYRSYCLSITFFALALLAKEVAIIFPILALLGGYCFGQGLKKSCRQLAPFFTMSAIYALFLYLAVGGGKLSHQKGPDLNYLLGAALVFKTYAYYIRMLFMPGEFNIDAIFFVPSSLYGRDTIYSTIALAWAAAFLIAAARNDRPLFFAFGWAMVAILPVANLSIILGRLVAEQRSYLPSVGYSLMMGLVLNKVAGSSGRFKSGAAVVLVSAMVVAYSASLWKRNYVWRDELSLWADTVKKSADKPRPHMNYANALKNSGTVDKSTNEYKLALLLNPNFALARSNLATAYHERGYVDRSVAENLMALFIEPHLTEATNNLANLQNSAGRADRAILMYKKALLINPGKAAVFNNIATIYLYKGLEEKALNTYAKAYDLAPDLAVARINRGIALIKRGAYDKAVSTLATTLLVSPEEAAANNLLGAIYNRRGQHLRAAKHFKIALLSVPLDPELHLRLANAYQFGSRYDKALAEYSLTLGLDRGSALAHKNLALLYMNHLGQNAQALRHFEISLQLAPDQHQAEGIEELMVELAAKIGARGR